MANQTPRLKWPYPNKDLDPWYDAFEALVKAIDTSTYTTREDRNIILSKGGSFTFNAGANTISFTDEIDVFSALEGFHISVKGTGSAPYTITINDGQIMYFTTVRAPTGNTQVLAQVSSTVPNTDDALILAVRRGTKMYFRDGKIISDGETVDLFESGGSVSLASSPPVDVTKSAAVTGVSINAARADHKHDISTGAPSTIGTANTEGSSSALARADHVHNHGNLAGGSLHDAATTSVAGFMSAADKTKLDSYSGMYGTSGNVVRHNIPLSLHERTDQSGYQTVGALRFNSNHWTLTGVTTVIKFKALAAVTSGTLTGYIQLYNLTDSLSIVELTTSSTTTVELVSDVTSSIVSNSKIYEVRIKVTGGTPPADLSIVYWAGFQIDQTIT